MEPKAIEVTELMAQRKFLLDKFSGVNPNKGSMKGLEEQITIIDQRLSILNPPPEITG